MRNIYKLQISNILLITLLWLLVSQLVSMIENRYNQFRILYVLYDKHYEIGGWQNINELLKHEDLKYIPDPIIMADIESRLRDSNFIVCWQLFTTTEILK